MMNTAAEDDDATQLLKELSGAKAWPERLKAMIDSGANVSDEIAHADKEIEDLEKRAREAMKKLGCDCSDTRTISQAMADMLINWHTFKDDLPLDTGQQADHSHGRHRVPSGGS